MTTFDQQRDSLISNAMARQPQAVIDLSLLLWEQLAGELTSLIGQRGFASLYKRSLALAGASYPCLLATAAPVAFDAPFADLKLCLHRCEEQQRGQASQANIALLTTLTDMLILLIGELLTINILRSAWGDTAPQMATEER